MIPLTNTVRLIRYHGQQSDNNISGENERLVLALPISTSNAICYFIVGSKRPWQFLCEKFLFVCVGMLRCVMIHDCIFNSFIEMFFCRYFRDRTNESNASSSLFNMAIDNGSWPAHVFHRFADVFSSHVIQVDIESAGTSNKL